MKHNPTMLKPWEPWEAWATPSVYRLEDGGPGVDELWAEGKLGLSPRS